MAWPYGGVIGARLQRPHTKYDVSKKEKTLHQTANLIYNFSTHKKINDITNMVMCF